jgi:hypothetical protein
MIFALEVFSSYIAQDTIFLPFFLVLVFVGNIHLPSLDLEIKHKSIW